MKIYKKNLRLGNKDKVIVAVNYKKEENQAEEVSVERLHHIHLLDRSISMSSSISSLIENVKVTLDVMSDEDLISVIWFSGEGECKTLIKGRLKRDSEEIKILLDSLKSTVGMTCFSEALQATDEIIEDLKIICPNFNVTFFTDGEPVTSDHNKELKDIDNIMNILSDKVMALNAIGYGHYYNKELLTEMTSKTTFGRLIHSEEVTDYSTIFSHNYEILSTMVNEKVNISANIGFETIYLSPKNSKLYSGEVNIDFLNKTKNQFFLVFDKDDITDATEIYINDTIISLNEPSIQKSSLNNFLYAMAYELYYTGRAEESLDILAHNLFDKALIDSHINAFTAGERQEHLDKLNKAIFANKFRMTEGMSAIDYIPKEDAFCVMDLLKILTQGDNYFIPLDSKDYNRIGSKVTDEFNLFKKNDNEEILAPMNELVFNAKHLNISLRYRINGKVNINPKQAKEVGLPKEIDSHIYRMQTLIKDGNLNMNKLKVRISKETYAELLQLHNTGKIKLSDIVEQLECIYEDEFSLEYNSMNVVFNLENLPIINRMYAKSSTIENILHTVETIQQNKAKQKAYKYFIEDLKSKTYNLKKTETFVSYTADQIRVLEMHGVNSKGDYVGVDLNTKKSEEDFYNSRLLEFALKGWSALPKVQDVIDGKKKNAPALIMLDAVNESQEVMNRTDLTDMERLTILNELLRKTKQELLVNNINLNTQKMAKVLTGGWWENLEVDNKQNYIFKEDTSTLIIKNDIVKIPL